MKNFRQSCILLAIILGLLLVLFAFGFGKKGSQTKVLIPSGDFVLIKAGQITIRTEVVDTPAELIKGLGGRLSLSGDEGMLFVFDRTDYHAIWMKEMLFPIDIIWLDEKFNVVSIKAGVGPETYPEIFYPDVGSRFVLEVKSGFAKENKISVGDTLNFVSADR